MSEIFWGDKDPLSHIPKDALESYIQVKVLPNGRICAVQRLMFHWTMHVDLDAIGYADKYCFPTEAAALKALNEWSGEGDPEGWHRHVGTGRRRNLETGEEWIAF